MHGMTMMVAAAGSASATTPPREPAAAARPPIARVALAAMARPAKLDRHFWPNMPSSPTSAAGGAAALVENTWLSVLIAGAASVHPCGTDMLPTRADLPIAPDTGPAPTAELSMGRTAPAPPFSGANAPAIAFGPA